MGTGGRIKAMINVFLRDGDRTSRICYTTARAAEEPSSVWKLLDIASFGPRVVWRECIPEELAGGRS